MIRIVDPHRRRSSDPQSTNPVFELANEQATAEAGEALAEAVASEAGESTGESKRGGSEGGSAASCRQAIFIGLRGSLGVGKTTLVRSLLRALGVAGSVRSPTYTLAEPYETRIGSVWHLDLYRMTDPDELEYIGIRDLIASSTLCLIEWPDRRSGERLVFDLLVDIEIPDESEDGTRGDRDGGEAIRRLSFTPGSEIGRAISLRSKRSLSEGLGAR
ncbi:tRNA (adenosine(37)-N6)-threonylcarbamoyltransferase complex ATPase subunit type 1 TsaE [Thioalkalivibrio sp. HK1]|uniref:tRNA (adenosine(37)-N6)-threonylcarbamoyltransferase complex ATPase subunit type 1 TsaE n=1 Tax=Thioalkalivibrio sp. HK1 TaxID=1469245 RepID=UPI00046F73C4|nr:tRNA (adenosine(37)-N6)-threonylcarbamoyltransferase complex ATPase subunit type 1 TsaE [Thioalkalivibrio sp. HK1]